MATYYWVGGAGTLTNSLITNRLSTVSGGSPGSYTLSAGDDIIFDELSNEPNNGASYTVTISSTQLACLSFTMKHPRNGQITWAGNGIVEPRGSVYLADGIVKTGTCGIQCKGVSGNWTFRMGNNPKIRMGSVCSITTGGNYTLLDDWDIVCDSISILPNTVIPVGHNLTITAFSNNSISIYSMQSNPINFYNLTINNGGANGTNALYLNGNPSVAYIKTRGNLTINGNNAGDRTKRMFIGINPQLSYDRNYIECQGVANISYCDFQDTYIVGSALNGTCLGDCGGNNNINFDAPVTKRWINNGGNFSDSTHWSDGLTPLPQDTLVFDNNSIAVAGQTIAIDYVIYIKGLDFSNVLNSPTLDFAISGVYVTDNVNFTGLGAITSTIAGTIFFDGRDKTIEFNPNSLTIPRSITFRSKRSTINLRSYLNCTGYTVSWFYHTFYTNNFDIRAKTFVSNVDYGIGGMYCGTSTFYWVFGGTFQLGGINIIDAKHLTIDADAISNVSTGISFNAGTRIYKIYLHGSATGSQLGFRSGYYVDILEIDRSQGNKSIAFDTAVTYINKIICPVSGTNRLSITRYSTTGTLQCTKTNGGRIDLDYVSASYITVTPSDTWYIGANSTNNAGIGFILSSAPVSKAKGMLNMF